MTTVDKIKSLKPFESNLEEFHNQFTREFVITLSESFQMMEYDTLILLFLNGSHNSLRELLDDMTIKSKEKIVDAIQDGKHDAIYETRYKNVKEINDLFTYYLEIID